MRKLTRKFCGRERVIVEPVGRNTAPAICLAALVLLRRHGDGVMHVMPADHLIEPKRDFLKTIKYGTRLAERGSLVTYGVKPDRPETGYGYIRVGPKMKDFRGVAAYRVDAFMEKPGLARARAYLKSGKYLWNAGIFTLGIRTVLAEIKKFAPGIYRGVEKYLATGDPKFFSRIPDISIDYAVMEKAAAWRSSAAIFNGTTSAPGWPWNGILPRTASGISGLATRRGLIFITQSYILMAYQSGFTA